MKTTPLAREALLSAGAAALLAAAVAWLGPPGPDVAAHAYQRALFLQHGFEFWNNFWYAGRYSFVTYSVLYYPLAGLLGIRLLAVATIATAALAFAVVLGRQWGPTVRWSSRTFAVVWAGVVLSAAFPFALGAALALLAIWALQARARARFACLAVLTLAASPVAFLLLAFMLAGVALARRTSRSDLIVPAFTFAAGGLVEVVLWRLFPARGHFPFPVAQLGAVSLFCGLGAALTWRVEGARVLRWMFVVYWLGCLIAFLIPSELGANIARLRYASVPMAVLALSLRRWRPLPVCLGALALAVSWNASPLVTNAVRSLHDPTAQAAYWRPAIAFLRENLTPSYRVEVVDTTGHWAADYLPRAGIPLARGWYRQDDFPQNKILYGPVGARAYRHWLRGLGVRYVVLTKAPPDYSAKGEAALIASGRSGLTPVVQTGNETVYAVPFPRPLVTGPGSARVALLTHDTIRLEVGRPGRYRVAVRYSPYWHAETACLRAGKDGMLRLLASRAGSIELRFHVNAGRALAAFVGSKSQGCS